MDAVPGLSLSFVDPGKLWLIPLVIVLMYSAAAVSWERTARMRKLDFFAGYIPSADLPSKTLRIFRLVLFSILGTTAVVIIAKPMIENRFYVPQWGGVRVAYLPDVSMSMNVKDVPVNGVLTRRIDAVRNFLYAMERLISTDPELSGGYQRTLVPFAGSANHYGGFTSNSEYMLSLIDQVSTAMITEPGSDFVWLFKTYQYVLDGHPPSPGTLDIAVVLSDGGNDPGEVNTAPAKLETLMTEIHPRAFIFAIGVGGKEEMKVPLLNPDGTDKEFARRDNKTYYTSALYEFTLTQVASKDEHGTLQYAQFADAERLVAKIRRFIIGHRQALAPKEYVKQSSAQPYFFGLGLLVITLIQLVESRYALLRRRARERPQREVVFSETAE